MNGEASSLRVTAWNTAPEMARFVPTITATSTRGSRMPQTISDSRERSTGAVEKPSNAATSVPSQSPNRSRSGYCGLVQTAGSNTAAQASATDMEYVPKLTWTSPATATTTQLPSSTAASRASIHETAARKSGTASPDSPRRSPARCMYVLGSPKPA